MFYITTTYNNIRYVAKDTAGLKSRLLGIIRNDAEADRGGRVMIIKKTGKTVYGAILTADERKALDMEARRALAEHTRKHELEIEAMIMRQVRRKTKWGKTKLKDFYMDFIPEIMELVKRYEMEEVDMPWLCTQELKAEGFDIEAWHHEAYPNEKYEVNCK